MARIYTLGTSVFVLLLLALGGCGGGGSSGNSIDVGGVDYVGDPSFFMEEIFFGRPLLDPNGKVYHVVNPASVIESDPITGLLKDDYPKVLYPGDELDELGSFNLGESSSSAYKVKIIPRNAAIILDFSKPVSLDSLKLKDDHLTTESPIQVLTESGTFVNIQVLQTADRVTLNPVTAGKIGLPPSPLLFDGNGNPTSTPGGYMKIIVYSAGTGVNVVNSTSNSELSARIDLLGTPTKPVGFNPGNSKLDFIDYGDVSFNGFLPDLSPPRIIREHRDTGTADASSNQSVIYDYTKSFETKANGGDGEWAGALLTLHPDVDPASDPSKKESVEVESNDEHMLTLKDNITKSIPGAGDPYLLQRAEFFEPIPGLDPTLSVDPVNNPKDPDDPEDLKNSDLYNFVSIEEWKPADGEWISIDYQPGPGGFEPLDPYWRISFLFSEPMSLEAFKPYETFYVCDAAVSIEDPGFDRMKPGRTTASQDNRVISFEPMVTDQSGLSGDRLIGFGGEPKALRLVIRVVPPKKSVEDFYNSLGPPSQWPPSVVGDLNKTGVLGVNDLGGQPLGLPAQFLDKGSSYSVLNPDSPGRGVFTPAVDLKYEFNTKEPGSAGDHPETGVLVHRFMGLPKTDAGGTPPITGLVFYDHVGKIYGPYIADTSVGLNGFLSGHAVEYIEQVFDDYNHPPPSSPTYPDQIFKMPFGVGTPITAGEGCRFQHVYRRGDCSPDVDSFSNTILDLVGLAWAPIGGWVSNTMIEKLSIGISYTDVVPITTQHGGIPDDKNSGLIDNFKQNILPYEQTMVVGTDDDGIAYPIDFGNLFGPKNQGLQFNNYHPWPNFHTGFGYDSTKSLLIEYRMDPNQNSGLSQKNGFAYMAGIMSSMLPRFRVYSRGDESQLVYGATRPHSKELRLAFGPLATPGKYGDNSRYLMLFNYVKRISYIESPFLGPDLAPGYDAYFLNPVIIPPMANIPEGTELDVLFDATPNPETGFPLFPGVEPKDVEDLMNDGSAKDFNYMRFTSLFQANVEAGTVPALDTVIVPYQIIEK